jgi:hypothetical protein
MDLTQVWNYITKHWDATYITVVIVLVFIMKNGAPIVERWIKVREKWKKASPVGKDAFIAIISDTNEYLKEELEKTRAREEELKQAAKKREEKLKAEIKRLKDKR